MQKAAITALVLVVLLLMPASPALAASYAGTFEYHSATPEPGFHGVINGTYTGSQYLGSGIYGNSTGSAGNAILGIAEGTSGKGVFGQALGTSGYGVHGYAFGTNSYAVYGYSYRNVGILGYTYAGRDGVQGTANIANGRGVVGRSGGDQGIGVFGHATSTNYGVLTTGVYGVTSGGKGAGVRGIALSGASINFGGYFESKSRIGYGVLGNATATSGANYGVLGRTASPSGYGVYSDGNMQVVGNLTATGTKSAVVKVGQDDHVTLYAEESTENWFSDYGAGELIDGKADVQIDLLFRETVNTEDEYHVFLTPYGKCKGLYVINRRPDGFEVHEVDDGESSIPFSYRIVVKRKGYESERMAKVSSPNDTTSADAANKRQREIKLTAVKN